MLIAKCDYYMMIITIITLTELADPLRKMQLESQHRTPLSPLFSQLKGVAARVAGHVVMPGNSRGEMGELVV